MKTILLILGIVTGFLLAGCGKSKDVAGSTETGNTAALVSGHLYTAGDPAKGAKVHFVRTGYDPYHNTLSKAFVTSDSAVTDTNGVYQTNNLDTGTYNVYGTGTDGTLSLIDSVAITGDTQVVQGDTLKAPASLAGHIKLQPGDEPDKIIAIAMGSNTFSLISTAAQFSFANLAEGHYAVKFFSTLDNYSNYDTTFTITAGANVSLPDSIVIPLKIPIPTGFAIKYDTLKQIVTLSWNRMDPARVKGYNVYRQHVDSAEVKVNAQPLLDTFYVDSTVVQDQNYVYSVASVDLGNREGYQTAGDTVKIVSAFKFIKNFGTAGFGAGQFLSPADIAGDDKGRFWVADGNRHKIMSFDSSGSFLSEWGDSTIFKHPFGIDIDPNKNIIVCDWDGSQVQKFDSLGNLIFKIDSAGIKIHDVSVDEAGNIYFSMVANGSSVNICKYDSAGHFLKSWQPQSKILHYALLVRNGKVYSAGTISASTQNPNSQDIIEVFDTAGTPLQTVSIKQSGETGVIEIRDLDVDATGNLYAVDPNNYKVRVFDSNLKYVTSFGKKGNGIDAFSWIQGIAISPNKTVAITDEGIVHLFKLP